jgi:hypothetical protein
MSVLADLPAVVPSLRLRPVPVAEPRPALRVLPAPDETAAGAGQAQLPLERPPAPATARALRPAGRELRDDGLPDPQEWAQRFAQVALEVAAGLRPPAQLLRWTTTGVLAGLTRRHALAQRSGGRPVRPTVRSLHVHEPADAVCEVSVVLGDGPRVRALALRLQGEGGRWRVTAFELG